MILDAESWMNIRRFRALRDAGATYTEIAAEVGCDWRTVKKYLAPDADTAPPKATSRRGTQPRRIDPLVAVVEAWLRADVELRGSVIAFAMYRPGAAWRPRPLSAGRAVLGLMDNSVPVLRKPAAVLDTLQQVISAAPAVKGVRGEAEATAAALLQRLERESPLVVRTNG